MTEQTKAEGPDVGESKEAVNGGPQFQRTPGKAEGEDPENPDTNTHATGPDQETTMASDEHLVGPPPTEAG